MLDGPGDDAEGRLRVDLERLLRVVVPHGFGVGVEVAWEQGGGEDLGLVWGEDAQDLVVVLRGADD